ncbi:gamma-glutamyltransferase [Armatimonas sp.]|uniref:gamma-glutamyltransferase n=1 Tax=Armatimonas sp. TaxID=1872638 RepID=UPI00286AA101|nr:gamma-glutamyltransferase [Armatimonas sp.]
MVASAEPLASQVGVDVMRRGGNAVDAAVAVGFTLAVTYPQAGNLGGGGFLMWRHKMGRTAAIDYREMAPGAAFRDVYAGKTDEGGPTVGWRASGTPGTVAGLALAHKKYGSGKLSFAELIEPARALAAEGFVAPESLVRSLTSDKALLSRYAATKAIFGGVTVGQRFKQPELAETLARIQKHGPREFYEGETAKRIASAMRPHGWINERDLRSYEVKERKVVTGSYRNHGIVSMPPPSSGGAVLIEILNILASFELGRMGWESPLRWHLIVEAMKRAFADRAEYFGDPDFVRVPVSQLTDPRYAARWREGIDLRHATPSTAIRAGQASHEPLHTTHFSIVDSEGNAVSNTYTLNGSHGSGVTIPGTGILMNNEMDDFAASPGQPNRYGLIQGENNAVKARKRPLSSMTPTFVTAPDGALKLIIGSPGGPTIINTVLQVILNVVDHQMPIAEAIAAPRVHHQWLPDEIGADRHLPENVKIGLERLGHVFGKPRTLGDAQGILIAQNGSVTGASDPRGSGKTL